MRIATAVAAVVLTCAVAAQVSAGQVANPQVITGNSQVDDILSGRVQRVGVAPGFEVYTEAGQMPTRVFEKFRRAMWKVIQKIDPWNLPQTLAQWPVRVFYLNRDTLGRLGLSNAGCQDGVSCGRANSRSVFMTLGALGGTTYGADFNGVTHEMGHLFLFRAADYDHEMWASTEFPGRNPGLIALGRWMVGRANERFGLNPTPPYVSEARFNQILQLAREEVFAGWPEATLNAPRYQDETGGISAPEYYWGGIRDFETYTAIRVASAIIWALNIHQPGTERAYRPAIAGIVAEVEAECARDGAC